VNHVIGKHPNYNFTSLVQYSFGPILDIRRKKVISNPLIKIKANDTSRTQVSGYTIQ